MSRTISHNNIVLSGHPSTYIGAFGSIGSISNTGNGLTDTSSENYVSFKPATSAVGGMKYGFNVSIPTNATIDSISCSVKIRCSNSNGMSSATFQLYAGDTAKGGEVSFNNDTSTTPRSIPNVGTWTLSDLNDIQLRITAKLSSGNRYVYFYGADLTITYSYNETQYQVTVSSETETSASISVQNEWNTEGSDVTVNVSNVSNLLRLGVFDNGENVADKMTNVSSNNYVYLIENINADHTIVLTDVETYTVSIINDSQYISSLNPAVGTYEVGEGTNFEVEIHSSSIEDVFVFDNNVDRTSAISSAQTFDSGSLTLNPSSYENNTFSTGSSLNNGYAGTGSTTRATLQASTSSLQNINYKFDVSNIPSGATILSVTCSFKICVSNSYSNSSNVRLYAGNTAKSNSNSSWISITAASVYTLTGIESFTRSELDNIALRISGMASRTGRSIYFYGADLGITYEYLGEIYYIYTSENIHQNRVIKFGERPTNTLYLKSGNQFVSVVKTFKKISGSWTEQTDLLNTFANGNVYIRQ